MCVSAPCYPLLDPARAKPEWSLMEGFVAEEGNDLLPPKSMGRTNLINSYQALLLAALLEEGLFDVSPPMLRIYVSRG